MVRLLLRVGRASGAFKASAACSMEAGSGAVSCRFWLPHLARDPVTQGLALGWAGTEYTGCHVSLVHSEVEGKAGCAVPGPGTGCKTHAGMQGLGQIHPAVGSRGLMALSSKKLQEISTVIYSFSVTNIFPTPSLSLLRISIFHVPPPPGSPF